MYPKLSLKILSFITLSILLYVISTDSGVAFAQGDLNLLKEMSEKQAKINSMVALGILIGGSITVLIFLKRRKNKK